MKDCRICVHYHDWPKPETWYAREHECAFGLIHFPDHADECQDYEYRPTPEEARADEVV